MNTHQVILHSQSPLSNVQQNIRQGDLLFVRVMKNLGGGNYLASFAGGRFTVKSAANLLAGQTFRAKVEIANGKLFLVPQMQGAAAANKGGAISVQNFSAVSPEVAAFLESMGLQADGVAERILQFLMQSGAKINPALMQKARRLASKYKGHETEAAEAALILEQKGIDSASGALDEIMSLLQGSGGRGKGTGEEEQGTGGSEKGTGMPSSGEGELVQECAAEVKHFFAALLGGVLEKSSSAPETIAVFDVPSAPEALSVVDAPPDAHKALEFEKAPEPASASATASVLSLFNQLPQKNTDSPKKSWILVPFEFAISGNQQATVTGDRQQEQATVPSAPKALAVVDAPPTAETFAVVEAPSASLDALAVGKAQIPATASATATGNGTFRLFLDFEKNVTEKCVINFKFSRKNLFFALYFSDKKVTKVSFWGEGLDLDSAALKAGLLELGESFGGAEVKILSFEEFSAFGTEDFPVSAVEGFA